MQLRSLPNPVVVDPLPQDTSIEATTSPAPEEKNFADYILVLPLPNIPPIYIYLSKPPVEFLEVEPYDDFTKGGGSLRSRWKDPKGRIYEWDSQHGSLYSFSRGLHFLI